MADNGKIIRNGAEIQIDENGNVVARPAAGQEFIVEDDAVVGSLEAEEIDTERLVENDAPIVKTWTQEGTDLDTQFGNAISKLLDGHRLLAAPGEITTDQTISARTTIDGVASGGDGTFVTDSTTLTLSGNFSTVSGMVVNSDSSVEINGDFSVVTNVTLVGSLTISANEVTVSHLRRAGDVTFESGTSEGSIGVVSDKINVIDEGNNEVLTG